MPIDFGAQLYDPVYAEIGVPATMSATSITVIDATRRKPLPVVTSTGAAEVRSMGPGAYARVYELDGKGIARDAWYGASLAFNGRNWTVRSYELSGSPNGEDFGEVLFLLKEAA
jgi:hypothetical protein